MTVYPLNAWKTLFNNKFDQHTLTADPLFVDPINNNYNLQPNSPAYSLGFTPIDQSLIGLRPDFGFPLNEAFTLLARAPLSVSVTGSVHAGENVEVIGTADAGRDIFYKILKLNTSTGMQEKLIHTGYVQSVGRYAGSFTMPESAEAGQYRLVAGYGNNMVQQDLTVLGATTPVADTTAPVITLIGNATVRIVAGSSYTDQGATASDDRDEDITSRVFMVSSVNSTGTGTCIVTYNVSDMAGNPAVQVTRTIVVTAVESVPITNPNVNITVEIKNVAITPETVALGTPITVNVPGTVTEAAVSVTELLNAPVAGVVTTSALPQLNIFVVTSLSTAPVEVNMPQGMTISVPVSGYWDGTIHLPKVQDVTTVSATADTGKRSVVNAVIEVGYGDVPLSLSKAVRILIPGMAGKDAGYYRGSTFTKITGIISTDSQGAADAQIPADGDAAMDVGQDKVIWTKHFTRFVVYTQTRINGSRKNSNDGDGISAISAPIPTPTPMPTPTPVPTKETVKLSDVANHWALADINKLISLGAIEGYPDGTFKPDNSITRAEFVKILLKALQLQIMPGKIYTDTTNHWADEYISTGYACGIADGYSDTVFGPDDLITREQMVVMVINAAKLALENDELSFTDHTDISLWSAKAISAAKKNGIINGYPDGTFKPLGSATRAEAVTVIMKVIGLVK